jgi:hypothetical protein
MLHYGIDQISPQDETTAGFTAGSRLAIYDYRSPTFAYFGSST